MQCSLPPVAFSYGSILLRWRFPTVADFHGRPPSPIPVNCILGNVPGHQLYQEEISERGGRPCPSAFSGAHCPALPVPPMPCSYIILYSSPPFCHYRMSEHNRLVRCSVELPRTLGLNAYPNRSTTPASTSPWPVPRVVKKLHYRAHE
jgi:hypothetical protein